MRTQHVQPHGKKKELSHDSFNFQAPYCKQMLSLLDQQGWFEAPHASCIFIFLIVEYFFEDINSANILALLKYLCWGMMSRRPEPPKARARSASASMWTWSCRDVWRSHVYDYDWVWHVLWWFRWSMILLCRCNYREDEKNEKYLVGYGYSPRLVPYLSSHLFSTLQVLSYEDYSTNSSCIRVSSEIDELRQMR